VKLDDAGFALRMPAMTLTTPLSKVLVFVPTLNDVIHLEAIADELHALDSAFTVMILDDGSAEPIPPMKGQNCLHFRLPTNFGLVVRTI